MQGITISFIGLDSTPIAANTSQNNPKSFLSNKFKPDNQPKADADCKLGVHTASNQTNVKKYEFYWSYKNHVLVDCISVLPIYELTTTANVYDSTVALDILADTHTFLPITECTFLANKGYDVKNIYNQVQELYQGKCIIPLNKRNTKNSKLLPQGNPVCEAGLAMWKDGKFSTWLHSSKFCYPLKSSKNTDCPCHHKNFYNGKNIATVNISKVITLFVQNARDTIHVSKHRTRMYDKSSVTNLNTIAHISLLAVAVTTITSGTDQSYRKLKTVKRIA